MKYITYHDLNEKERLLVDKAFEAANHSEAPAGHKIGSAILCEDGQIFQGCQVPDFRDTLSMSENCCLNRAGDIFKAV